MEFIFAARLGLVVNFRVFSHHYPLAHLLSSSSSLALALEVNRLVRRLAPKYRNWLFPTTKMKVLEPSQKENTPKMKAKTFQHYLPEGDRCYSCIHCRANLASHNDLISKSFQGSQGKAYLFNSVVNVGCGPAEERILLTGAHTVADIYCECCKTTLGWKYEHAYESSQKYKEGKFIIELAHMVKDNGWEGSDEKRKSIS
ncbi:hypothetical protein WR25_20021 [Diploscapter pachys]|uniref:Yippee domain-containing protein n=1 Tax=Diploscapter pachys TaxID=2018661 RepID=A0A2A2JU04_9BILA|nr:hypothetical protein WR25_20021 [Diploscapter pachys]